MDPRECPKFNHCLQTEMILDKDLMDWQYAGPLGKEFTDCSEAEDFLKQAVEQNFKVHKITMEYKR